MAMLWMETYMLYCSVRLGVLFISILAFISLFIPSILFFAMGLDVLDPVLKLFNDDEHFRKHFIVNTFTNMVDNDSNKLMILFQLYFFAHMTASILAFYGTWKVKKYFLLPLIFIEFIRVIYCLISHVLIMTVCKNRLNLGVLITTTLAGGFLILFLAYNWATCVALYQIITLVNSERYKFLYGDDPFKPLIPKTYNPLVTENVRVLITPPNNHDIDEQKKRNALRNSVNRNLLQQQQQQPVISVIPANYIENNLNSNYDTNAKWKLSNWPTTKITTVATPPPPPLPPPAQQYPFKAPARNNIYDNNYDVNYGNWQWSELTSGVTAMNTKNIYNRNY